MIDISKLEKILENHGTTFAAYCDLLLKWNRTYNLTAITEPDDIWEKHFLDSIVPLPFLPETGSLLDIGSGAGFPGIPLKIARPALSATLLEATQKKYNFCNTVIRELGLKDIRVVHGRRIECHSRPRLNHSGVNSSGNLVYARDPCFCGDDKPMSFDIIISRATFSLKEFIKLAAPYLKDENSKLIAMKGADIEAELKDVRGELKKFSLKVVLENYLLSNASQPRTLVVIQHLIT